MIPLQPIPSNNDKSDGIFGIFGGGAGYRGQNRTQREKSLSNMGVKTNLNKYIF